MLFEPKVIAVPDDDEIALSPRRLIVLPLPEREIALLEVVSVAPSSTTTVMLLVDELAEIPELADPEHVTVMPLVGA